MADRLSEDRSNRMSAYGVKEKQTRYLTASGGDHSKTVLYILFLFVSFTLHWIGFPVKIKAGNPWFYPRGPRTL